MSGVGVEQNEAEWWRQCEIAWSARLQANGYAVTHLNDATNNSVGTTAPLISIGGLQYRAPDLQSVRSGVTEYWEIKYRQRANVDPLTGRREFWIHYAAFQDYLEVSRRTGCRVWVVVYEGAANDGRWLVGDISDIAEAGTRDMRFGQGAVELEAWVWPVDLMDLAQEGPLVASPSSAPPLLPDEGEQEPVPVERFTPLERRLRRRRESDGLAVEPEAKVLVSDARIGLDVLRRSLGVPRLPRYSVLRIGGDPAEGIDLVGLVRYGIRLFTVTTSQLQHGLEEQEFGAFRDARLIECAVVDGDLPELWIVDGQIAEADQGKVDEVLKAADEAGGINGGQFAIVHAPQGADVLVTAGAGTGKTETMSERLVFLLATVDTSTDAANLLAPYDLGLHEMVLVTFSNESAREMRSRIARTLLLRQRLCERCVLPAVAWMLQLSNTSISTIHSYAKQIVTDDGGVIGLSHGVRVSAQTIEFRELVYRAMSERIPDMLADWSAEVPPAHELRKHVERIWNELENRGVRLVDLLGDATDIDAVDWAADEENTLDAEISDLVETVIGVVAEQFASLCRRNQVLPLSQLVPAAADVVGAIGRRLSRSPRFVFVDEFQDTDATQLELVLSLKERLGVRLFVVGDVKQGVYRFRGAQGNAFDELRDQWQNRALTAPREYRLSRNFRSGGRLLDSLHPYFSAWGREDWLRYTDADRLLSRRDARSDGRTMSIESGRRWGYELRAARLVAEWRSNHPEDSLAVLCRNNSQAIAVQRALRSMHQPCRLRVGGSFFQTPAVQELRVLLEAVANPSDAAALLELCETRWFAGLATMDAPFALDSDERAEWSSSVPSVMAWADRFSTLSTTRSFHLADLAPLRRRVELLGSMLEKMPVLAWVVEVGRLAQPRATELTADDDAEERRRYGRCFDHLVTLVDEQFADAPLSVHRLLEWLRLRIATDRTEDEPQDLEETSGVTVALTVHKSKGLEFDRVLIPNSWTSFNPYEDYDTIAHQIAVSTEADGSKRLTWRWRTGRSELSNRPDDQVAWADERVEVVRDEARLLYVALTRARHELVVFVDESGGGEPAALPRTWGELLSADLVHS